MKKNRCAYLFFCICAALYFFPLNESQAEEPKLTFEILGGDKDIIAPGQSSESLIILKNHEDKTLDYILYIKQIGPEDIPLQVKVIKGNEFLLGEQGHWIDISDDLSVPGTIKANAEEEITVIWQWQYYVNDKQDIVDTRYAKEGTETIGNMIDFNVWEESGGIEALETWTENFRRQPLQTGDKMAMLAWSLVFLISLSGLGIYAVRRKKLRKERRL